jgi:hypothetical protein
MKPAVVIAGGFAAGKRRFLLPLTAETERMRDCANNRVTE